LKKWPFFIEKPRPLPISAHGSQIDRRIGIFETIEDAYTEIVEYLEMYYNTKPLHSSLNYRSPMTYEKEYYYCLTKENFVSV